MIRPALTMLLVVSLLAGCSQRPRDLRSTDPTSADGTSTVTYRVQEGDDWEEISETFFGDASRASRIAEANGRTLAEGPDVGREVRIAIRDEEMDLVREVAEARGPYNRGVELMALKGKEEQAREAFAQALDRAPHFVDARYNLGLVLLRLGRPDEAIGHFRQVVSGRPDDVDARYGLAAALFHAGNYPAAIGELESTLELDVDHVSARFTYALALERLGRTLEARKAWRAFLERDSESNWATEARQRLRALESSG